MIFIVARFRVKPEHAEDWISISKSFTDATLAEPGNLWFDWSRSVDDPQEFVLLEAFADQDAAVAHVTGDHFKQAQTELPPYLVETPRIVNTTLDIEGWSELGELAVE